MNNAICFLLGALLSSFIYLAIEEGGRNDWVSHRWNLDPIPEQPDCIKSAPDHGTVPRDDLPTYSTRLGLLTFLHTKPRYPSSEGG